MQIKTTRFGHVEVDESKIIHFKRGILGFPNHKEYALLDPNTNSPLKWLQSIDEPALAFVITEPSLFISDYKIDVFRNDLEELETETVENLVHFVIVTVPSDPSRMTANLKGPLLINLDNYLAKQLVLDDPNYELKYRLLPEQSLAANG